MSAVLRLKGEGQEGLEMEGMVACGIVKALLTLTQLNVAWILGTKAARVSIY